MSRKEFKVGDEVFHDCLVQVRRENEELKAKLAKKDSIIDQFNFWRKEDNRKIDDLESKLEHKDYILDLWKRFVDTEYPEGKTLDAYIETLEEIEKGE